MYLDYWFLEMILVSFFQAQISLLTSQVKFTTSNQTPLRETITQLTKPTYCKHPPFLSPLPLFPTVRVYLLLMCGASEHACVHGGQRSTSLAQSSLIEHGLLAGSSRGPSVSTSWCWDCKGLIQHVTYFCLLGFELRSLSLCGRRFSNWAVSQDPTVYVSTFTVSIMTFSLASSTPKFSNSWLLVLIYVHIFCNLKIVVGLTLVFEFTILPPLWQVTNSHGLWSRLNFCKKH